MLSSTRHYFSSGTIEYLSQLKLNNNKSWFEENKPLYTEHVLQPTQSLVAELSPFMLTIDPFFETSPVVGKTISRMYRDTRFSKDKSPYRTNVWITFKRPKKEWIDAPAFFFELSPDSYRFGMGFYSATKETMDHFRDLIDQSPADFERVIAFYSNQQIFKLEGERYKKILDPSKPKEILDWYQRKNLYLVHHSELDSRLFGNDLIRELTDGFGMLADLYLYLSKVKKMQETNQIKRGF